ncbi:uncharacterized protein LOC62_02G003290 [Vanrija pseudolonga]|uniref:Uncharacterized protein n=1 Tax=Vanrija pseudolonga TaxID=143232 RepID=A0AAF0Y7T7_9TREE|nr:hypothetical protein LOC62_02G003290 [Vanrija pseudolonga]
MSFCTSAIAGPSRLPACAGRVIAAQSVTRASAPASRRYASSRSSTDQEKRERSYNTWLSEVGWQYKTPERGAKAKWLGGDVPFESNPSFKPPPPLSNDLQNIIYKELRAGKKTLGEISQAYSISKNRILAIGKLKAVEEEFRRQVRCPSARFGVPSIPSTFLPDEKQI